MKTGFVVTWLNGFYCYRGDEEIGEGDTFQLIDPQSAGFEEESIELGLDNSQVIFDLGLCRGGRHLPVNRSPVSRV